MCLSPVFLRLFDFFILKNFLNFFANQFHFNLHPAEAQSKTTMKKNPDNLKRHKVKKSQKHRAETRAGHVPTFLKSFRSEGLDRSILVPFYSIVQFSFRSFTNRFNIFKNAFYVFVLFSKRWDHS